MILTGGRKQADYSIHDYVSGNHNSFDQQAFNDIDGVILTQISNMNLEDCGIGLYSENSKTIAELYNQMYGTEAYSRMSSDDKRLLKEMAESGRYQDITVRNFVKDPAKNGVLGFEAAGDGLNTEQFAAATITLRQNGREIHYLSFRATDGTTDGWNEDVLMVASDRTQAQTDSVAYMNLAGGLAEGILIGGGHSKGGNDFQYGYLFCDERIRDRIAAGYLYDSPGLYEGIINGNPNYEKFQKIIEGHFICPQDSIIGQLLHENENARFVHSVETGFDQHDPYSWEINRISNEFVPDEQTEASKYINDVLDNAVNHMSLQERQAVYAFISYILYHSGGEGIEGLSKLFVQGWTDDEGSFNQEKLNEIWEVVSSNWEHMSKEQQEELIDALGIIFAALVLTTIDYARMSLEEWVEQKKQEIRQAVDRAIAQADRWIQKNVEQFKQILKDGYQAIVKQLEKLVSICSSLNAGCRYTAENPYVQVDTYKLKMYAGRIAAVNRRVSYLDLRIKKLYWRVCGVEDLASSAAALYQVMRADLLAGYSPRLAACVAYLNSSAADFENAEANIIRRLVETR